MKIPKVFIVVLLVRDKKSVHEAGGHAKLDSLEPN